MYSNILVSIFCLAYNHEKYIREALEGFLMQKTNFDYEVLIHEDASTDSTAEILKEYETKYPNIIRVVYESENKYGTGLDYFYDVLLPMARGKYIAVCEGDDAWIDDKKLQIQVDYMEKHPECSIIGHKSVLQYPAGWEGDRDYRCMGYENEGIVPYDSVFMSWNIPTSSFLFRKDIYEKMPRFFMSAPTGDEPLLFYLAGKGYIYFLDRVMSIYNKFGTDSWSTRFIEKKFAGIATYYKGYFDLFQGIDRYTNGENHDLFVRCIKERVRRAAIYILFNSTNYEDVLDKLEILSDGCDDEIKEYIMKQIERFWFYEKNRFEKYCEGLSDKKIYIYGAGKLATKFLHEIVPEKTEICGIIVSDGKEKKDTLEGKKIYYLSEVNTNDSYVILATNDIFSTEMKENLKKRGFSNYMWIYEDVFSE